MSALLPRLFKALVAAFFAAYAFLAAWLVAPLLPHERVHPPPPPTERERSDAADDHHAAAPHAHLTASHAHGDADPRPVVSFGGCGFLYVYQLGAAAYIADAFDTSVLRCAGHSAGFASALTLAAGVPPAVHWAVLCAARRRWSRRALGPFLDATRAWMAPYVEALAPYDARIAAAAADGRLALGYTRLVATRSWPPLRAGHAIKAGFASLADFVYSVTVSQRCPPFYRAPGWLHGAWGLDGAFSAQFTLPPGCSSQRCVSVSPTNPLADVAPASPLPLLWFFTLPDEARWATLHEMGYRDAAAARATLLRRGLRPREAQDACTAAAPGAE